MRQYYGRHDHRRTEFDKNASVECDPEMHSTQKGNQWYFGMKIHIGVDAGRSYTHTVEATAANEHDITQASSRGNPLISVS